MGDKILFKQYLSSPNPNNIMISQSSSIPSFPYLECIITIDFLATLILCAAIAFCFVLLYHILFSLLSWLQDIRPNRYVLEQTQSINMYNRSTRMEDDPHMWHQVHFHRSLVRYNVQLLDMLERYVLDIDERRGERLREMNRLPPLISYGSQERRSSYRGGVECVICLEDFEDGESCQVLPACNHIFHVNCIDHWLKNRPTCPVCRNCLLEV